MTRSKITIDDEEFYLTCSQAAGVKPCDLVEIRLILGDGRKLAVEVPAWMKRSEEQKKPEWLTRSELQGLLRVSRPTVEKLLRTGEIPATKVGRQWRILREDVDAFLRKGRSNG